MNLLLVDSSTIFRVGLRATLAIAPQGADMTVIAECGDGRHACELATSLAPDVVITDFHLPDRNGIALARELGRVAGLRGCCSLRPMVRKRSCTRRFAPAQRATRSRDSSQETSSGRFERWEGVARIAPGRLRPSARKSGARQAGWRLAADRAPVPARASDLRSLRSGAARTSRLRGVSASASRRWRLTAATSTASCPFTPALTSSVLRRCGEC